MFKLDRSAFAEMKSVLFSFTTTTYCCCQHHHARWMHTTAAASAALAMVVVAGNPKAIDLLKLVCLVPMLLLLTPPHSSRANAFSGIIRRVMGCFKLHAALGLCCAYRGGACSAAAHSFAENAEGKQIIYRKSQ